MRTVTLELLALITSTIERLKILTALLAAVPNSIEKDELADINTYLNGYTGADIMAMIREAIFRSLNIRQLIEKEEAEEISTEKSQDGINFLVTRAHIEEALGEVNPSGLKDIIAEIPKVLTLSVSAPPLAVLGLLEGHRRLRVYQVRNQEGH